MFAGLTTKIKYNLIKSARNMYVFLFRDLGEEYFRKFRRRVYLEGS